MDSEENRRTTKHVLQRKLKEPQCEKAWDSLPLVILGQTLL